MEGWIKIHRKIMENPMYFSEPFTRMQAWIDLLLLANRKDGYYYVRGNKIIVHRGKVGMSEVSLSKRWKWSRSKVSRFLKDLENEQQIEQQKNSVTTLISIINYDEYQQNEQQIEQQTSSRRAADEQQTNINKNSKNSKNINKETSTIVDAKKILSLSIEKKIDERSKIFYDSLIPYVEVYGKKMIRDFYDYWTEPNKSKTKMRFELESTWDLKRRINRWYRKDKVHRSDVGVILKDNDESKYKTDSMIWKD
jgi:hypothetical protein